MDDYSNGLFGKLEQTVMSPLFLGGAGLLTGGGFQGLQQGIAAARQNQAFNLQRSEAQREEQSRQALAQGVNAPEFSALSPQSRSLLAANPDIAKSIAGNVYQNKLDPMAALRAKLLQAQISGIPADQAMKVEQLNLLREQVQKARLDRESSKFMTVPDGTSVLGVDREKGTANVVYQGSPKMAPADKKALYSAEDELPNVMGTIEALTEARNMINPTVPGAKPYTQGAAPVTMSQFNQSMPDIVPNIFTDPERAKATLRMDQLLSAESIANMSNTLKGSTTDREMAEFKNIMANPRTPPEVKIKAIDTMLNKARRQYETKASRIQTLGGKPPPLPDTQSKPFTLPNGITIERVE